MRLAMSIEDKPTDFGVAHFGSALQALYELPLAYFHYKTDPAEFKHYMGVIVEKVNRARDIIKEKIVLGEESIGERKIFDEMTSGAFGDSNLITYTKEQLGSIVKYLDLIIAQGDNAQNVLATVGVLLKGAKETQERLLKLEASTFGRDADTIPGVREPVDLDAESDKLNQEPIDAGLNRIVKALAQEVFLNFNPTKLAFDTDSVSGSNKALSRLDVVDKNISGDKATNESDLDVNNGQTADINLIRKPASDEEQTLTSGDNDNQSSTNFSIEGIYPAIPDNDNHSGGSTYPYAIKNNHQSDTFWKGSLTTDPTPAVANDFYYNSTSKKIRAYSGTAWGDIPTPPAFNGLNDAVNRVVAKLDALTYSINGQDYINAPPVRLDTIRSNIATIIKSLFNEDYNDQDGLASKPFSSSIGGEDGGGSTIESVMRSLYAYVISFNQSVQYPAQIETMEKNSSGNLVKTNKDLLLDPTPTEINGKNYKSGQEPPNAQRDSTASIIDLLIATIGVDSIPLYNGNDITKPADGNEADWKAYAKNERFKSTFSTRLSNIEYALDNVVKLLLNKTESETDYLNLDKDLATDYSNARMILEGGKPDKTVTMPPLNGGGKATLSYTSIQDYIKQLQKWSGIEFDSTTYKPVILHQGLLDEAVPTPTQAITKERYTLNGAEASNKAARDAIRSHYDAINQQAAEAGSYAASNIVNLYRRVKELEGELGAITANVLADSSQGYYQPDDYIDRTTTGQNSLSADVLDIMKTLYGKKGTSAITFDHHNKTTTADDARFDTTDNVVSKMLQVLYKVPNPYRFTTPNYVATTDTKSTTPDSSNIYYDFDTGTFQNIGPNPLSNANRIFYFTPDGTNGFESRFDAEEKGIKAIRKYLGMNLTVLNNNIRFMGDTTVGNFFNTFQTTASTALNATTSTNISKLLSETFVLSKLQFGYDKTRTSYDFTFTNNAGDGKLVGQNPILTITANHGTQYVTASKYPPTIDNDVKLAKFIEWIEKWNESYGSVYDKNDWTWTGTEPTHTGIVRGGIPENLFTTIIRRINSNYHYATIAGEETSDYTDCSYYDNVVPAVSTSELNPWNSRGIGVLRETNQSEYINKETLTLRYYDDDTKAALEWESSLAGVDILPPTSTIIRPKMRQPDPYNDMWSNVFAHHDLLKYHNSELKQLEAEFVSRISNINRRLIHLHPILDTRTAYNLHVWGTEAIGEWSAAGEYDLKKETELSASMSAAASRLEIGISKRLLELERFLWYYVAGKLPEDQDWLCDPEDDDLDRTATMIGFHTGLVNPAEKGQPDGTLEKLSLLDGDPIYGQLDRDSIATKGSVLPRLKGLESKLGSTDGIVNDLTLDADGENQVKIAKKSNDATGNDSTIITTIKSQNGIDLTYASGSGTKVITIDGTKLVTKADTQTISGEKTFTGNLIRSGTGTLTDSSTGAIILTGAKTITQTSDLTLSGVGTITDSRTGAITISGDKTITITAKQTIIGTGDIEINRTDTTAKLDIKRPTTFDAVPTLPSQTAKTFFAAPTGANGAPSFRVIEATDLPTTITSDTTGTAGKATGDKDGAEITTTYATKLERSNNDIMAVSLSGNTITLTRAAGNITATVGDLSVNTTGNAATATKLASVRTITISGKATGTATSFDGSGNISIPITDIDATGITSGTITAARLPLSASVTGNNYAVQSDASGKLFVAVPWTNTVYSHPTGSGANKTSGLYKISTDATSHISGATAVVKSDITALGIPAQDTVYSHPSSAAGAKTSGLYKITTDATGHITAATAVIKSDITALGIPGQDTNTWPTAGLGLTSGFAVSPKTNGGIVVDSSGVSVKTAAFSGTGDIMDYLPFPLHIDTSTGNLYVLIKPTITKGDVRNAAGDGTIKAVTGVTLTAG